MAQNSLRIRQMPNPSSSDGTTCKDVTPEAIVGGLEAMGRSDVSLADALGMTRQVLDVLLEKALGLAQFGKYEQAEAELMQLTSVDGFSPFPPFALGAMRAQRQKYELAIDAYGTAEERAAKFGLAHLTGRIALCRGHAAMMLGDAVHARSAFELAVVRGDPAIAEDAVNLLKSVEGSS